VASGTDGAREWYGMSVAATLAEQGTVKIVILVAILVAGSLWMVTILVNYRGIADRQLNRIVERAPGYRSNPFGRTPDQQYRFAKSTQRIVVSLMLIGLLAFLGLVVTSLMTDR
jgi:hypothetical protein